MISHLLYADDLLVFLIGEKRLLTMLVKTLGLYEKWSSQLINKEKSTIYPAKTISLARKRALLRMTSFVEGHFPVVYLGVPLVSGRLLARCVEPLVEKIRNKVAGWKVKILL